MTTPDIADLCKRLRRFPGWCVYGHSEAADTLERQAAEIERLRTELEKVAAYYGPDHRVTEIARAALTGEDTATLGLSGETQTDARTRGDA